MSDSEPEQRPTPRREDTRNPHRSRERALRLLFQAEIRGVDARELLTTADRSDAARRVLDDVDDDERVERLDDFTRSLVSGAARERDEVDALLGRFARGWRVSRMPAVDRTILRLATYEMLHEDTAHAIVIDEAVEFAKSWSTSSSGGYVNGVLEAVRRDIVARGRSD